MKTLVFMQSAQALGTNLELQLSSPDQPSADRLFAILWDKVEIFQNQFSRFLETSELTKFNFKSGEKVEISKEFNALLRKTQELCVASNGLFNPFILPLLNKVGYVTSFGSRKQKLSTIDYRDRKLAKSSELVVGKDWARIPRDTAIDLGGIGKGYLADKLADILDSMHTPAYCLSIGGDIISKNIRGKSQRINVQSLDKQRETIGCYDAIDHKFAIATSGLSRQKNGKIQYHLLDPRSGDLAKSKYQICSVAASDATTADVMASCILIGGEEFAEKILENKIIKGVLLQDDIARSGVKLMGKGFKINERSKNVDKLSEIKNA